MVVTCVMLRDRRWTFQIKMNGSKFEEVCEIKKVILFAIYNTSFCGSQIFNQMMLLTTQFLIDSGGLGVSVGWKVGNIYIQVCG